jgi:hypothetical protein
VSDQNGGDLLVFQLKVSVLSDFSQLGKRAAVCVAGATVGGLLAPVVLTALGAVGSNIAGPVAGKVPPPIDW